jgi:integrase/recombinase XerD
VVDLLEPDVLAAVNDYVSNERPRDTGTVYLLLVGGSGMRHAEPLSYQALRRMFTRRCESDCSAKSPQQMDGAALHLFGGPRE